MTDAPVNVITVIIHSYLIKWEMADGCLFAINL